MNNNSITDNKLDQKKKNVKAIILGVIAIQLVLAIVLGIYLFKSGYQNTKSNTAARIRQDAYSTVYDITENANHTSNRAIIQLDDLREKADLEVLQVSTNYLYVSDDEDRSRAQVIWYKIPGTGTFTVDLQRTEFIVDNDRQHVLVRAPLPAITKFKEDIDNRQELEYRDDRFVFKGNISEGETTARKILFQAHTEMMKDLETNKVYLDAAKDSAVKLITNIIKALNPNSPDLIITVEFNGTSTI